MKTKYILLLSIALFLGISSCNDDKGNYDYKEIGEITINGLEEFYDAVAFQSILKIPIDVTSTDKSDQFTYLWTLDKKPIEGENADKIKVDTISFEQNLEYTVSLKQGYYNLTLYVQNKVSGYQIYQMAELAVTTAFSRGFYIYKELDGYSEVDLRNPSDNIQMDNLIESVNGEKILGKPVSMGMNFGYFYIDQSTGEFDMANTLNVITDKDFRMIKTEDMSTVFSYDNLYYGGAPQNEQPYYMFCYGFGAGYATSLGMYCSIQWGESSGGFGFPQAVDDGCKPNIHVVSDGMSGFFYDEKNGRFLTIDWNGDINTYSDLGKENETKEYKPNNIEHELLFYGRGGIAPNAYALFKDKQDESVRYLYHLTLDNFKTHNPIEKVDVLTSTKLNDASLIATNQNGANVIYTVNNNEVYMRDMSADTEEKLTLTDFPISEQVTCIAHKYWIQGSDKDYNFNYLIVATYSGDNYKIFMYELVGAKPYGKPKYTFSGKGKVHTVQYTSPKMAGMMSSSKNYPMSY